MLIHKRINDVLSIIVAVLAVYILMWPLMPQFTWLLSSSRTSPSVASAVERSRTRAIAPDGRRVIIPALNLTSDIYEGLDETTLNKGVWRRPLSATPDLEGNTVLAGHRFMYSTKPAVFYHLDKVKVGDEVIVEWDNSSYVYRVEEIIVVKPDAIWVEDRENGYDLTLYTCTPLWTSNERLVLRALKVEE